MHNDKRGTSNTMHINTTYALRHNLCIREQHIQAHSTFTIRHFSFLGKEIEDENQLTFVVVFYLL